MSGSQSAPPAAAGLQGPGIRVSVTKIPSSGLWRITVALPNGVSAISEHLTFDGAWERRYELRDGLLKNLPPVLENAA